MNPLARDPEALELFRERVDRGEWRAARRLGLALQLHRATPQRIFEDDTVYLERLADAYAKRSRRSRR